ncbi:hypothetical protein FVE67_09105 [Thermosulfurimonas marina]|uniref:Organic solvent tolerance-like N-terminal domain-containing protein n=1 Tax=Thermosulfurimonas marina TaxID=2047767 RepID=A0A6H1WUN9_9BACT|nr:LptA/OstA family protein [Thermosulfurimonas marina]QJA06935.1 hypothetical protein FVE67_09105 [Thermosulfurimonas marina]
MDRRFGLFLLLVVLPLVLAAVPIDIRSDKMEVLEDQGLAIFTGHVVARKGDLHLWARKLYVYYSTANGTREVKKLIALGEVRIEKGQWRSLSGKAVYFRQEDRLVLEDHPRVWHGKDEVRGDLVIIYFRENRSEVLSRGRPVEAYVYTD